MAKKKQFTKKQLARKAVQAEERKALRAIIKAKRANETANEKAERRRIANEAYNRKEHNKKTARNHTRVRRYVFLIKHIETGVLRAWDRSKNVWSSSLVTLYDCGRYVSWADPVRTRECGLLHYDKTPNKDEYKFIMVRAGSKKCPIKINYEGAFENNVTQLNGATVRFTLKNEDFS